MTKPPRSNEAPSVGRLSHDYGAKVATIAMPGILSHSDLWVKPIVPVLENYGDVTAIQYGNGIFNPEEVIKLAVDEVTNELSMGRRAVLLGSSLGGDLAPFVAIGVKEKMQNGDDIKLSTILVDAPYGARTLAPIPEQVREKVSNLNLHWNPSRLTRAIGNATVMRLMTMPWGMPNAGEMSFPIDANDRDMLMRLACDGLEDLSEPTNEDLAGAITELARQGLTGNDFGAYVTQNEWLINIEKHGDLNLGQAIDIGLRGLQSCVLAARQNNVTVVQPLAQELWLGHRTDNLGMVGMDVHSPHVAYHQKQPEWARALRQAYAELDIAA